MSKPTVATVWLDGCSGCHMSLIDMDERILDIFSRAELVYSPLVDYKEYPEHVDVCLVEGAVSSEDDLHKVKLVREHTDTIIAFGDCAVTSNVPGMRNPIGVEPLHGSRLSRERDHQRADAAPGGAGAPADVGAGAQDRRCRRLPARLPALCRSHLHACLMTCSPVASPRRPGRGSVADGSPHHESNHHHRSGHADRGPLQDHHPAR